MIRLEEKNAKTFVGEAAWAQAAEDALQAEQVLKGRQGAGNDFLGWIDLPEDYDKEEFARIKHYLINAVESRDCGYEEHKTVSAGVTFSRRQRARE